MRRCGICDSIAVDLRLQVMSAVVAAAAAAVAVDDEMPLVVENDVG